MCVCKCVGYMHIDIRNASAVYLQKRWHIVDYMFFEVFMKFFLKKKDYSTCSYILYVHILTQLNWYKCWMGGESWHAIKKLFNPPFLILKVRHPAVTGAYCIGDSRSGCSIMISNVHMYTK